MYSTVFLFLSRVRYISFITPKQHKVKNTQENIQTHAYMLK